MADVEDFTGVVCARRQAPCPFKVDQTSFGFGRRFLKHDPFHPVPKPFGRPFGSAVKAGGAYPGYTEELVASEGQWDWWRGVLVIVSGFFCAPGLWHGWAASLHPG